MPSCVDSASSEAGWKWEHSYASLPDILLKRTLPTPVSDPRIVVFNQPLARQLGLDSCLAENAAIFVGNQIPEGALPIAQAYAGHQFGHFTSLGDGRAILLGEQIGPEGSRVDVQLKGAGRTPYSRGGDGRAALGPMLREYIISEAMHALGIPTTRSLAVATTGEEVVRTEILEGAVLTRVAASHIRVGTFQHAAAHEDLVALRALADHTRKRHYPDIADGDSCHFELFQSVMHRQAELIAKWMHVGFIHGVMNTDNMALSGETIDYGPCAFMDDYDPDTVFSSIDRNGRYAYDNQAAIARWNLARLAEAMLPLFSNETTRAIDLANEALGTFEGKFQHAWLVGMRSKLGLFTHESEDGPLVRKLLDWMHHNHLDYTQTFRTLSDEGAVSEPGFIDPVFLEWHERWSSRLSRQPQSPAEVASRMQSSNPAVIPRNHKVEEALTAATRHGDYTVMERLLVALASPFSGEVSQEYMSPPVAGLPPYQTYCGT
jgi:serine/tyrosine/threonine adenylyltransferase